MNPGSPRLSNTLSRFQGDGCRLADPHERSFARLAAEPLTGVIQGTDAISDRRSLASRLRTLDHCPQAVMPDSPWYPCTPDLSCRTRSGIHDPGAPGLRIKSAMTFKSHHRSDELQQQLLQRVGVVKGAPGVPMASGITLKVISSIISS